MGWLDWLRPRPQPPPPASTGLGGDLLEAVNEVRVKANKPPLTADSRLDAAAAEHASKMAQTGVLSHQGFPQRLTDHGYHYSAAAENVAMGQNSADLVVESWMSSLPHRANMLGDYADFGGSGAADVTGRFFWCAEFANPA